VGVLAHHLRAHRPNSEIDDSFDNADDAKRAAAADDAKDSALGVAEIKAMHAINAKKNGENAGNHAFVLCGIIRRGSRTSRLHGILSHANFLPK
jgi:hypothetical protein